MPRTGPPSLKDRTCIWCGTKPEYTLLIRRTKERNFRQAIRFEVCDWHASETIERLGKLLSPTDHYLYEHLAIDR